MDQTYIATPRAFVNAVTITCAVLLGLTACKRDRVNSDPQGKPPTPSAAAAASQSSLPPSAAQPSAIASSAVGAAEDAGVAVVHCKARGKRGFVPLGTLRESPVKMVARDAMIWALTYNQPMARASLMRVPRDGSPAVPVVRHTGLGDPVGLVIGKRAAYFTRNRLLVRMPLDGSDASVINKDTSRALAWHAEDLYGITCEPKNGPQRLVRYAGGEGEAIAIAEINQSPKDACDYRGMAMGGSTAFISDWGNQRVLAVSLDDKSVKVLATKKPFASALIVDSDHLILQAAHALFRIPQSGGDSTAITKDDIGGAPFFLIDSDASDIWLYDTSGYTDAQHLYRLPRAGGAAVKVETFPATSDVRPVEIGIYNLAVDDECVYLTREFSGGVTLLGRSKG